MVPVWGNVVARVEGIPHLLLAGRQEDAVIGAVTVDEVGSPGRPRRKCYGSAIYTKASIRIMLKLRG